jgi:DDE superfamily endonuclease
MGHPGRPASLPWTHTAPCRHPQTACAVCWSPSNPLPSRGPGAPVRPGPAQSPPVASRPPARTAGGVACPRRCSRPLPHGLGAAARRLRDCGGPRRHAAGGAGPPRHGTCRRAGGPPLAPDGTCRRSVRPQDPPAQTAGYSGKKKDHTRKNILWVHALLLLLCLSETAGGRLQDKRRAEAPPYPLPVGSRLWQALGCLAFTLPQGESRMPTKQPCGQALPGAQQRANQALHERRLRLEHVPSSVKRCRIGKDRSRLWQAGVRDLVRALCWALHHFRGRLTPWPPMV